MKIAQFETVAGFIIGVEYKGRWIDYGKAWATRRLVRDGYIESGPDTILGLLERGWLDPAEMKSVIGFVGTGKPLVSITVPRDAVLRAPILRPPKIVALGLNYAKHAEEGSFDVPDEPILFLKPGSAVVGPEEDVRIPRGMGRMDHEVELAVVISRRATGIPRRHAEKYIAGYTICNDVTARDVQTKDLAKKHPWFRSKGFDTFAPLGPWIVTPDELPHPLHLKLECRVNGKLRQKANTRNLVFDVPTLIEVITRNITLEPGDIVSTGTPEGIGPIKKGDTMVCRIQGIGELRNRVRYR